MQSSVITGMMECGIRAPSHWNGGNAPIQLLCCHFFRLKLTYIITQLSPNLYRAIMQQHSLDRLIRQYLSTHMSHLSHNISMPPWEYDPLPQYFSQVYALHSPDIMPIYQLDFPRANFTAISDTISSIMLKEKDQKAAYIAVLNIKKTRSPASAGNSQPSVGSWIIHEVAINRVIT